MMPVMTTWEVYEKYRIMPKLRLHQLRVAALAHELSIALGADTELVTKAALLHDMGNIMKADFTQFPEEFYDPEGVEYWEGVKKECGERYGADEHIATNAIAKDIGASEAIIQLIGAIGFSKVDRIKSEGSTEEKILEYADQRVAPLCITSLHERLQEGRARYKARARSDFGVNDEEFERKAQILFGIEQELFAGLLITPEMFTEESLTATIESLRDYVIA